MDKERLYVLSLEQFREHPRIYWTRNTFFVFIQSGLIAVASINVRSPGSLGAFDLVLSTIGFFIAIAWLRIALASRALLHKWRQIIIEIEEELFKEGEGLFQRSNQRDEAGPGLSITGTMVLLAKGFMLSWLFLLAYVAYCVVFER